MRWLLLCGLALSCAAFGPTFSQTNPTPPLRGFNPQSSAAQRSLEARFDAALKKENLPMNAPQTASSQLTLWPGGRRVHCCEVSRLGLRNGD